MFLSTLRCHSRHTFPILRITMRKKIAPVTRLPSLRFHSTQNRVSSDTNNLQNKFKKFKNFTSLFYNARQEERKESLQEFKVGTPVQVLSNESFTFPEYGRQLLCKLIGYTYRNKRILLGNISSVISPSSELFPISMQKLEVSFDNGDVSTYGLAELKKRIKESHKWKKDVLDEDYSLLTKVYAGNIMYGESDTTTVSDLMNCGPFHWNYTFLAAVPEVFQFSLVGIVHAGFLFQTFDPTYGLIFGAGIYGTVLLHELGHRWAAQMCGYRSSCVIMNPPCVLIPESGIYANPTKEMIISMAGPLVGGISAIAMGVSGIIMSLTGMEMSGSALICAAAYGCLIHGVNGMPTDGSILMQIDKEHEDENRDGNNYRKAMNEQYENESKSKCHLYPGLAVLKYIFAAGCATSLCGVLFLFCLLFCWLVGENKEAIRKFFEEWKLKIDQWNCNEKKSHRSDPVVGHRGNSVAV